MPPLVLAAGVFATAYAAAAATRWLPADVSVSWCRLVSGWLCIGAGVTFVGIGRRQRVEPATIPMAVLAAAALLWGMGRLGLDSTPALLLRDLAQLSAATLLGAFLAGHISSGEILLALGIVVTVTDLWSVHGGVTRTLIEAKVVDHFLVNFPVLLQPEVGFFIGTSDFVMASLYITCSERLERAWWRAPAAIAAGMIAAGTLAITLRIPLPVLPFMVVTYHLAFPRDYTLGREGLKLLAAGLGLVGALALLYRP
ncbi:MAG: hypothetical protein HY816_01370 [Candidatus Wallbacteria bacterium]|nr:hypothetical protein [Candidatus Wallbacteria bacterium]